MSDLMSVRLRLLGVRVRGVLVDSVDRLEVEVESTRAWSRCPHCGFKCFKVSVPASEAGPGPWGVGPAYHAGVAPPRFVCSNCEERHLEVHTRFDGGLTRRFVHRLVQDARRMSIRAASRHHGVGWHRNILRLVSVHSERVAKRRRARPCRVLLVDETSIRRRHRYVTVVACADVGRAAVHVVYYWRGRRLRNRLCAPVGRLSGKVCGVPGSEVCGRKAGRHSVVERNKVNMGTDPGLSLPLRCQCGGGQGRAPTDSVGSGRSLRRRCEVGEASYMAKGGSGSAVLGLECQEVAGEYGRSVADV